MAQRKSGDVDSWLARPDPSVSVVVLYGPDHGLVSERARAFAEKTGIALDDPFANVRLDAADIEADPARLYDEIGMVSMFSARRLVWVRNAGAGKALGEAVRSIGKASPQDALLLIEAGDLKKSAPLRVAAEGAAHAMALPCFFDDGRALDRLIDDVFDQHGLRIRIEARTLLKQLLGGDRLASRGELEKLALYRRGETEVDESAVRLLIGDVSATSAEDALNAALSGELGALQGALQRYQAGGGSLPTLLLTAHRQLIALGVLRAAMDRKGHSAQAVVAAARPPLYFDRKAAAEKALTRLSTEQFRSICERFQRVTLESRKMPDLADAMIERVLIALAGAGRPASRAA